MLLAIDIGNTSVSFGLFNGRRLVKSSRLKTNGMSAETIKKLLSAGHIDGVCISSVVPRLNPVFRRAVKQRLGCRVLFVTAKNAGIKIPRYNKRQIGADRLVNAVAAFAKYKRPCIVIDLGTATTFDYVTHKGEFGGGVIAPGIGIINDALSNATAKLPRVKIAKTKQVVAQNTKDGMQSGIFHGYVGLVDHIVSKMTKETKRPPHHAPLPRGERVKVIATGGFARIVAKSAKFIEVVNPSLTLEGLRVIWEKNK